MTAMSVLVLLLAVVVALLAVLVAGVLRSHAEILRALHDLGPEPGSRDTTTSRPGASGHPASDLTGTSPDGDAVAVAVTGVDHPTLLAFLTSNCTTCIGFWNAFGDLRSLRVPGGARLVVVTEGGGAESPVRLRKLAPRDVPVVMSGAAWDAYDVTVAPYFVYVDGPSATVVGEGPAASWAHVSEMFGRALADAGFDPRPSRVHRRPSGDRAAG